MLNPDDLTFNKTKNYKFNHNFIFDNDIKYKTLEMENMLLTNEIKRNNTLESLINDLRIDMNELKTKFLELCEIVNELPLNDLQNSH